MLIGAGNLCLQVLKILAPRNAFEFYVASRNQDNNVRLCNLVRLTSLQLGVDLKINPLTIDLFDVDRTAQALHEIQPDIIFNCSSLQSWRRITELPKPLFEELDQAQFGPWLPMHLATMHHLMQAVRQANCGAIVVNSAFPDAVNPVLHQVGLSPHIGIGNVANLIPATRCAVADQIAAPLADVQVKLITQHYFSHFVPRGGLPDTAHFHLQCQVVGQDISNDIDPAVIFDHVRGGYRRLGGIDGQFLTAASAVQVLAHLFSPIPFYTHAPGPLGLPGGYPVRLQEGVIQLDLPESVSEAQAVEINRLCQIQDGIATIERDGTVEFGEKSMEVLARMLGYSVKRMALSDAHECAIALGKAYQSFVGKTEKMWGTQ